MRRYAVNTAPQITTLLPTPSRMEPTMVATGVLLDSFDPADPVVFSGLADGDAEAHVTVTVVGEMPRGRKTRGFIFGLKYFWRW